MRTGDQPALSLLNRQQERAALDGLLGDLRSGRGRALMVRGQAGVGKTALLEYVADAAADMRVARAAGMESEMELAFASLHLLCAPLLDRLERLPVPQRDALGIAFGLREGDAPDRFLVALAVLTLLSEVAEDRPLLCLIDDAQWLDAASAQALAFAARRLLAEPVGLVFATRAPGEQLRGLTDLEVEGLPDQEARALLRSVIGFGLDERVQGRILAEANGNPLALLELPRGLDPAQLAGGLGLTGAVPARIEAGFRRRLEALPEDTRSLMLVAALEPTADPILVWRAAGRLGIPASASAAAEADGLLEIGTGVRFRHPLVRSAVYSAASLPERRAAHAALAEVTDRDRAPDRRAWHLAAAAPGPDEQVAAELERSAGRAQARGGMASAAAFLQRSVELTAEPHHRSERALAAAQASLQAGAFEATAELLTIAAAGPLDELQQARVDLLRGQNAFASSAGGDAPAQLVKAARQFEPLDAGVARQTYLDALYAALNAGEFAGAGDLQEVSRAALSAPPPAGTPSPSDVLLDGLAVLATEGRAQAAPLLSRAARAFAEEEIPMAERLRRSMVAVVAAVTVWDEERWHVIEARALQSCREAGLLAPLVIYVNSITIFTVWHGDFAEAASLVAEAEAIAAATGTLFPPFGAMLLAGFRGAEGEAASLIEAVTTAAQAAGQGLAVQWSQWVAAILYNGLGRYEAALAGAQAAEQSAELHVSTWALPELIEAATRTGQPRLAADALGLAGRAGQYRPDRLGPGNLRAFPGAAQRRRGRRELLSRGDWPAGPHRLPARARPRAPALRGMAAPRAPADRRAGPVAHRARHVRRDRHAGVRRTGAARAAGHRRDRPQAHRLPARPAQPPGSPDRPPGPVGPVQPGDRRPAVPVPAHRRVPHGQGLRQARYHLPPPAPAGAARQRPRRTRRGLADHLGRGRIDQRMNHPGCPPPSGGGRLGLRRWA